MTFNRTGWIAFGVGRVCKLLTIAHLRLHQKGAEYMKPSSDVVIIGGGAAGCSVAYHLGLAGVKATIIEGEGIGSQASGFSAGAVSPLEGSGIPGPLETRTETPILPKSSFS